MPRAVAVAVICSAAAAMETSRCRAQRRHRGGSCRCMLQGYSGALVVVGLEEVPGRRLKDEPARLAVPRDAAPGCRMGNTSSLQVQHSEAGRGTTDAIMLHSHRIRGGFPQHRQLHSGCSPSCHRCRHHRLVAVGLHALRPKMHSLDRSHPRCGGTFFDSLDKCCSLDSIDASDAELVFATIETSSTLKVDETDRARTLRVVCRSRHERLPQAFLLRLWSPFVLSLFFWRTVVNPNDL